MLGRQNSTRCPVHHGERVRIARHEAGHAVIAWLIGWQVRTVRVSPSGGFIDTIPDFRLRPAYRDTALSPFLVFTSAPIDAFRGDIYDGPLPAHIPPGGERAVADVMAILLAGYAVQGPIDTTLSRANGNDVAQVNMLVNQYPSTQVIAERLTVWMPTFIAEHTTTWVDAVADALMHPSDRAAASMLGDDDLRAIRGDIESPRFAAAARLLHAHLNGLAWLAQRAGRGGMAA